MIAVCGAAFRAAFFAAALRTVFFAAAVADAVQRGRTANATVDDVPSDAALRWWTEPVLMAPSARHGWVPPDSGIPGAVRAGVEHRWSAILAARGAKGPAGSWATKGTRQLRAPYEGGTLCLQCHGALR